MVFVFWAGILSARQWPVINLIFSSEIGLKIIFLILIIPKRDNLFPSWPTCATSFSPPKTNSWQTSLLSLSLHSPSVVIGTSKQCFVTLSLFCIFLSIWPAPSYLIITPARQVWQAVVPMVTELMCGPGRQVRLTPCGRAETGKTHQLLETCEQCMVWLMKYWGTFSWKLNHEVDSDSFFLPYFIGSRWLSL